MNLVLSCEGCSRQQRVKLAVELNKQLKLPIGASGAVPLSPFISINLSGVSIERLEYMMSDDMRKLKDAAEEVMLLIQKEGD